MIRVNSIRNTIVDTNVLLANPTLPKPPIMLSVKESRPAHAEMSQKTDHMFIKMR